MQIQILSDLHLDPLRPDDLYTYDIPVRAEYLALLGDTGRTCDERLFKWLDVQLTKFGIVFYLSGNNEPRGSSLLESHNRLKEYESQNTATQGSTEDGPTRGRFIFLNKTRFDLTPTFSILGCTLWGAVDPPNHDVQALNDFKLIHDFTPEVFLAEHQADRAWLNDIVMKMAREEPERRVVVFTHHAPTVEGTSDPKNQGKATSAAFATELTADPVWTAGNVVAWAFGHTHWCCDFVRGGVRVYSNQRARGDGVERFDRFKVLSL